MTTIVEKDNGAVEEITTSLQKTSVSDEASDGRRVIFKNLPYTTTVTMLATFLKGYQVESISSPETQIFAFGFGFVTFSTSAEAQRAIAELSGKKILDRRVSVQLARPPKQQVQDLEHGIPSKNMVIVKNLPLDFTDEEKLKELFSAYKPTSAKITLQHTNKPRKRRGLCSVTFASEEIQKKAIEEMNGKIIEGQKITVSIFIIKRSNKGANGASKASTA